MKSRDTESDFELYVTRTPGYLWALFFKALHVHPIAVTLMSIIIGAAAGICFYWPDLNINLIGIGLLIWANWYDCADGQLARMTNQKTLIGRILDGFAGDVWFWFIYWAIIFRMAQHGIYVGIATFLLCYYAGIACHAKQCAIADYYRNIHLWVILGEQGSELNTSEQETQEMARLKWCSKEWFHKLYLYFYIKYTRGQERQSPQFQLLYKAIQEKQEGKIAPEMRERFRQDSLPLMPITNILTFDTRVGVLIVSLLIGHPWIYPLFEVTVLEWLRVRMIGQHEAFCTKYLNEITKE